MSIERTASGSIVITGKDDIALYQLLQWKHAIRLEIKGLHFRGGSVSAHVKRQLGFKGNKEKVLAQLEAHIEKVTAARSRTEPDSGCEGGSSADSGEHGQTTE